MPAFKPASLHKVYHFVIHWTHRIPNASENWISTIQSSYIRSSSILRLHAYKSVNPTECVTGLDGCMNVLLTAYCSIVAAKPAAGICYSSYTEPVLSSLSHIRSTLSVRAYFLIMAGLSDPMRFMKAEEFFADLSGAQGPKTLISVQSSQSIERTDPLRYAAFLTFDEGSTCLFQFVTPQLWRIRFDPSAKTASAYSDANS